MQLTTVEAIPIALPFRGRYRTSRGELDRRSMAVVRLDTDSGWFGLGEAVPLSLRGGPGLQRVVGELRRHCADALAGIDLSSLASGDPVAIRGVIWSLLGRCRRSGAGPQAVAAVDIALHDLAGRVCGLPVWRLLGCSSVREIDCNASLDAGTPREAAERAAAQAGRGFSTFKIKVGVDDDRARVAAVREAVGERARIRVDANGAWSVEQAVSTLDALLAGGLELAEQPCATVGELAAVRARTDAPIVADESIADADDAGAVAAAGACDAATLKLAKVGGPLEALRIAALVPSYLSSALDGPIGIAAAIHTAQALPSAGFASELAHGLGTLEMFAASYAPVGALCGPRVRPPAAPGIGVEVDWAALEELRVG